MSAWRETTLGEVITLQRGFDLTEKTATSGPYPVISSGGYSYMHTEAKAKGPGVVTGRKGVLGKVHYCDTDYWPHDTTLWVRDFNGACPRFIYYFLQTLPLAQLDAGASNPTLNRNHAHLLKVRVPDNSTQQNIAVVLGSIDDFIENNRRRIEVLEEMAQAIYREWFVHFRYPGHEDVTFVDSPLGSIPDSWTVRPFTEVASFVNGFAFKPSHWAETGRPIIKIKELKNGVTADTPRCEEFEIKQKYWIQPGDLLFSWSADLGVYRWSGEPGLLNQHLFLVEPLNGLSSLYLQHSLAAAVPRFWDRAQGTTMRHIKRSALTEVMTVVPSPEVDSAFADRVRPLDQLALRLTDMNRDLVEIRGLLLPKLVTGEIDVSDLDLDALIEAMS